MLSSSSLTQFFIAGVFLMIAFGGALINFNLIAMPLSSMVGVASNIGPYKTSDVVALFIILIELTMGLFLMESLRITRLFPVIGSMDDKMRHLMMWLALSLLTILAGVDSALAFMSEQIAQNMEALRQSLAAGLEPFPQVSSTIPTVGQMIIAFILPFALAFVSIPLESFVSSFRMVLGMIVAASLRSLAFLFRLIGNAGYYTGRLIVNLYDLLIFPSIWLESVIVGSKTKKEDVAHQPLLEDGSVAEEAVDNFRGAVEYKEQQD